MIKMNIATTLIVIFCSLILGLSLRGLPGTPTAKELNTSTWKENGPLELSPDRGRYALAYSLAEDKSLEFSIDIARFTTPDLAISPSGKFVSLFAPTLSYLVLPGYFIGRQFDLAQVGAFAVVSFFAVINVLLIRWIAIRLGAEPIAATIGAFAFLFATPAFTYAVTLYQHHITVFMVLSSIAVLMKWEGLKPLPYVWFMCGLSISLDNPNLFFMLPIALYALARVIYFEKNEDGIISSKVNPKGALTLAIMVIPIIFFLWFNWAANGSPFQLSGTLPAVKALDAQGNPSNADQAIEYDEKGNVKSHDKTAVGSFRTRNLLEGFYIHFISPDRGILWYAPVVIVGFIGLWYLYKINRKSTNLLIAVMGANILLYSMWGDPWGGWAFGSRYLIPSYAILGIGMAIFLSRWQRNYWMMSAFVIVLLYSSWVNSLGAITSSANPPKVEVLALEKITGTEQKYTFERNMDLLENNISKSYLFQTYFYKQMSAQEYHTFITTILYGAFIGLSVWLTFSNGIKDKVKDKFSIHKPYHE